MSTDEPSYPEEAAVGDAGKAGGLPQSSEAATPQAKPPEAKGGDSRRNKHVMAGAAIGIGSAAIVAALLYANRSKRSPGGGERS